MGQLESIRPGGKRSFSECYQASKRSWAKLTQEEDLGHYLAEIRGADPAYQANMRQAWNQLCKPLHSLGVLEDYLANLAALQRRDLPALRPVGIFCMVADNGLVTEGVSQCGQEVTSQVLVNMAEGKSTVAIMAQDLGLDLYPVNLGAADYCASACPKAGVIEAVVRPQGTRNLLKEAAMTRAECLQALVTGIALAEAAKAYGYQILIGGEMGIGNTSTSTLLSALLLNLNIEKVCGRGAGLSDQGLDHKKQVLQVAYDRYADQLAGQDITSYLSSAGGLDIAALTGLYLGAAHAQIPVILDGLISYTAALAASRYAPEVIDYLLPSHQPREKCSTAIAQSLGLKPSLDLDLALGEGAGAIFLLPLLDLTYEVFTQMPSFEQGQVEAYEDYASQDSQQT